MLNTLTTKFLARYPGPYCYKNGSDGVDDTFDVICLKSGKRIASTFYWYDRLPCEIIARVITQALNAPHPENDSHEPFTGEPLSDREIAAFRGMHRGPYRSAKTHCDYRGPGYEVLCESTGESVVFVYDHYFRGQARLATAQIAAALNAMR